MLRFLSAGEYHGPSLVGIVDGMPAGLPLSEDDFLAAMRQRQSSYGRGEQTQPDQVELVAGVMNGRTIGAPIALRIVNGDAADWKARRMPPRTVLRPGHADLAGALKYDVRDLWSITERASARVTAVQVAIGVVARRLLGEFGIATASYVVSIGAVQANPGELSLAEIRQRANASDLCCADLAAELAMRAAIDRAKAAGDSVGGVFEVRAEGVPPGLGSHAHWDRRLDGLLAQALMSVPGVKGVEIGAGFGVAGLPGTQVHDEILPGLERPTNRAGGIEGGISNGQPIVARAAMKPVSTIAAPLRSVDLATGEPAQARYQRVDICAVPGASVVGEAMLAWVLAVCFLEKFGGDSIEETKRNLQGYLKEISHWSRTRP